MAFLLERARPRPSFLSSGSEDRNHFFFSPLIKTVAFPTTTARLVTPLVPPAGRGRPLSTSQCFAGRYFSRRRFREKERATRNSRREWGNEDIWSGKMRISVSDLRNFAADHCTIVMSFLSRTDCGNCACAQKHVTLPLTTGTSNKQPLNPQLFFSFGSPPSPSTLVLCTRTTTRDKIHNRTPHLCAIRETKDQSYLPANKNERDRE